MRPGDRGEQIRGDVRYELTDHLGNVRSVITDRKLPTQNGGGVDFAPDVVSAQDYYPFGMLMPGRQYANVSFTNNDYRFAFQGQEGDDEWNGDGNSYAFKYRIHDPRIGRFYSIDPLALYYPSNSQYAFSENQVINAVELEGLEKVELSYVGTIPAETVSSVPQTSRMGMEMSNANSVTITNEIAIYDVSIDMQYVSISEPSLAVNGIDGSQFSDQYSKGNGTFYSTGIAAGEVNLISRKEALSGTFDLTYQLNVQYNYEYLGALSLSDALDWKGADQRGRGIIFGADGAKLPYHSVPVNYTIGGINTPMGSEMSILAMDLTIDVDLFNREHERDVFTTFGQTGNTMSLFANYHLASFKNSLTGGVGNAGDAFYNFVMINRESQMSLSVTLVAVHEAGHNASGKHLHGKSGGYKYEYNQQGLQSNTNPYPSQLNTQNILNEYMNR